MQDINSYNVEVFVDKNGNEPFNKWLDSIPDTKMQAIISTRIDRVEAGNLGVVKSLKRGLFELKIDKSPGYRVYFSRLDLTTILLLWGGIKRSQSRDISLARSYLKEHKGKLQ